MSTVMIMKQKKSGFFDCNNLFDIYKQDKTIIKKIQNDCYDMMVFSESDDEFLFWEKRYNLIQGFMIMEDYIKKHYGSPMNIGTMSNNLKLSRFIVMEVINDLKEKGKIKKP